MQRIGLVVFPGFSPISFAAMSVFELANVLGDDPSYEIRVLSEHGGRVKSSLGMSATTEPLDDTAYDTLIVGGGMAVEISPPGLVAFMRAAPQRTRRVAAICVGAFVLADAGVLDGRRATTHWAYARDMQKNFPNVTVDEDRIFIQDGAVWTSAGMTAGIDLALAMVEADLGAEIARGIARKLVMYHRRAGGQSQFSALLELAPKSDRIQKALAFARDNLQSPLSVADLADAASLSPRQFSRAFHAETGQSPAKAIEHLRLEAARLMMEQSRHAIDTVAQQTGFADRDRMRRAFLRAYGQPPQVIRRNARAQMQA
jgi:transcriptional regulator GlxA family with amidase domain